MTEWRSWLGKSRTTTSFLDPEQANRMAVTLDREPDFAESDVLPTAWHWLYFHDLVAASHLGRDGHPALGVTMPPVPLTRRMWASGQIQVHSPLRLGSVATRTATVRDIAAKEGRSGPLFFVTVQHDVRVDGALSVSEKQTIVYRELSASGSETPLVTAAPEPTALAEAWQFDSTALFRYSALTFNGHRIHYDADYSRDVEGYPGLVVHGPLLATLLADLGARIVGTISRFHYRARTPVLAGRELSVDGRTAEDGAELWVATEGRLAMEARAYGQHTTCG